MKIAYDFHIHTALSPCGDDDMTPNNIVNMAVLKGLDAIAITDHNTCRNAAACIECAHGTDLLVLPGMEVETAEECHVVCIFPDMEGALGMEERVAQSLPKIKNRPDIFGTQAVMDSEDNITGYEERLLVTATSIPVDEVAKLAKAFGGVAIPAHIDKSAYSIISNLGFIDDSFGFKTIEFRDLDRVGELYDEKGLDRFRIIHSSDAHYLWDISEREHFLEVDFLTEKVIIDILSR